VARVLKEMGWNVVFVDEVGLSGHSDEDVCAFAWRENRILLTHDHDFLDDRRFPYHRNPGMVSLPGASGPGTGLVEALREVLGVVGRFRDAYRGDKIKIDEDGTWTIKGFNKELGRHYLHRYRFDADGKMWEWELPLPEGF
jgi:hypothetical protein